MRKKYFLSILLVLSIGCSMFMPVYAEQMILATDVIGCEYVDLYDGCVHLGDSIGDTYADGYARFPRVDFGNKVYDSLSLTYSCAKGYNGGVISVWLDSQGGTLISQMNVAHTETWESFKTVELEISNPNINGVHDMYVTFSKRTTCTLKSLQFNSVEEEDIIPSDIAGTEFENVALKLTAFGIISLDSEKFRPDDIIKNSEVISAVKKINPYFSMSDTELLEKYSVKADAKATSQDILKIFACASGYVRFKNYISYMHDEGIFNGVSFNKGNITRGEFLKCIDNFLDARIWVFRNEEFSRSDETVLEKCLGIIEGKGIVMSDKNTAIVGEPLIDTVYIGKNTYYKNGFDTDSFIGQRVKYYYTDEDESSIVYMHEYNNDIIILEDEAVESFSDMSIHYMTDEGRKRSYKVSDDFVLILNNKVVAKFEKSLFETFNGTLKIIDNNEDGKADVLIMRDTYDIYVDSFSDNVIYGKNGMVLDINDKELIIRKASGVITDEKYLSNIKKGSVLTVAYSDAADGTELYEITISNINIKGIVQGMSQDENGKTVIRIDGVPYKLSELCTAEVKNFIGEEVNVYLSANMEIAEITRNVFESVYGYAIKFFYNIDDEKNYVKIFGEDNIMHNFACSKNLKIDGYVYKTATQQNALKNAFSKGIVIYTLNSEGELAMIDFPYTYKGFKTVSGLGKNESDNSLYLSFEGSAFYRWYGRSFSGKSVLASNAIVFLIPDNDEQDKYRAVDAESYFSDQETYEIKAYGTDIKNFANPVYSINYDGVPHISTDSSIMFVKSVGIDNYYDEKTEEVMSTLKYMRDGQEFTEYVDSDGKNELMSLEAGDVVKIGYSLNGYVTKIQQVFDVGSESVISGSEAFNSPTRYLIDSIAKAEGNYAILDTFDEIVNLSCNNIYVYDNSEISQNKIRQGTLSELVSIMHEDAASKVFISQRYGQTNGVLILINN